MKYLKYELYVLVRRWGALLLILGALIGSYILGSAKVPGTEQYNRRVDAGCYWLLSESEFERNVAGDEYYMKYTHRTLEEIFARYGLEAAGLQTLEEIYPLTARAQYLRILWYMGSLIFLCAVLPPVLIRYPLKTGVPDLTVRLTGERRKTVLGKIIAFYLVILLCSLICTLIQVRTYARYIVSQAGFAYVLGTLLVRLIMDMAVLSVPMYLAFLIRSVPGLVMLNTAYGVACTALNIAACNSVGLLPIPIPAYLHGLRPLWQAGGPKGWIAYAVLVSLAWIVLFTVLSLRCFTRTEVKAFGPREAERSLK